MLNCSTGLKKSRIWFYSSFWAHFENVSGFLFLFVFFVFFLNSFYHLKRHFQEWHPPSTYHRTQHIWFFWPFVLCCQTLWVREHIALQGRVSGGELVHTVTIRLQTGWKMIHIGDGSRTTWFPELCSFLFTLSLSLVVWFDRFDERAPGHGPREKFWEFKHDKVNVEFSSVYSQRAETARLHEVTRPGGKTWTGDKFQDIFSGQRPEIHSDSLNTPNKPHSSSWTINLELINRNTRAYAPL